MNRLQTFFRDNGFEEVSAMNWLQDRGGLIADEAVEAKDVPDCDAEKAIDALERNVR